LPALVSIIVASYNKAGLISETIDSVVSQTYSYWELLLLDDASSDGTDKIIRQYSEKDERIKPFLNHVNKGANYCRNTGLKEAKGKYLVFLDADDLFDKKCLEERVKFMEQNQDLDFSVFSMLVFKKKIGDSSYEWIPDTKRPLHDFLSHNLPWQTMQPIWKTEFMIKLGGFDESFQRLQDVELHTRALLVQNVKYLCVKGPSDCYFRIDEGRKNFSEFDFLERWVNSTLKYCDKFTGTISARMKPLLLGTVYQTYLQILLQYRLDKIQKKEFLILEKKLMSASVVEESNSIKKFLLKLGRFYNLHLIRIPGINKLVRTLIIF
jgi:glycosyltransferase involved in cell wall biosynthesis